MQARRCAGRLELRAALARAVRAQALDLAYQPIVDLASGEAAGVEALARWTLDGQAVPPSEFIPLAGASGLISELGAWVLERACADVAPLPLRVSVNVSAVQLRLGRLHRAGGRRPGANGLGARPAHARADRVGRWSMTSPPSPRCSPRCARSACGSRSTTSAPASPRSASLAELPVDALKLDRSFIAAMGEREALVAGVISLADRLGLPIVAEGIETARPARRAAPARLRVRPGLPPGPPGAARGGSLARVKALAIDGGGIRGLIPATVLAALERRTGRPDRRAMFDLIAGTSTGGILACALARPPPTAAALERARSTPVEGPRIFSRSLVKDDLLGRPASSTSATTTARCATRCAATSATPAPEDADATCSSPPTTSGRAPRFFAGARTAGVDGLAAAQATAAAPTYFEPVARRRRGRSSTAACSPATRRCAPTRRRCGCAGRTTDASSRSGTGSQTRPIRYEQARGWGMLEWARPIIDVVFDGSSDAVDYQLDARPRRALRAPADRAGRGTPTTTWTTRARRTCAALTDGDGRERARSPSARADHRPRPGVLTSSSGRVQAAARRGQRRRLAASSGARPRPAAAARPARRAARAGGRRATTGPP